MAGTENGPAHILGDISISLFVGWIIADAVYGDGYGWPKAVVFFATWIILGIVLQRIEFKGAPKQIEYIDS